MSPLVEVDAPVDVLVVVLEVLEVVLVLVVFPVVALVAPNQVRPDDTPGTRMANCPPGSSLLPTVAWIVGLTGTPLERVLLGEELATTVAS